MFFALPLVTTGVAKSTKTEVLGSFLTFETSQREEIEFADEARD